MRAAGLNSILFLLLAYTANGDDPQLKYERDPWAGFGVGSWVIEAETISADGKTTRKREKQTLAEGDFPGQLELKVREEGKTPGVFDGEQYRARHVPGYDPALDPERKAASTTRQELTIQGKKYACEVKKYELSRKGETFVVTYWHCKDANVPYRDAGLDPRTVGMRPDVLRMEVDYRRQKRSEKTAIAIVNFREEKQIGGQKVVCVREQWEADITEGDKKGKAKATVLLSNDVPGHEVESTAETELGDTRFKKQRRIEAFHAVREK